MKRPALLFSIEMEFGTGGEKIQRLVYQIHLNKLRDLYGFLRDRDCEPVLIKGAAAAANYPKPFQRVFGDVDLAVAPSDYRRVQALIRETSFNVDLHRGLRHLDTLEWEDLFRNTVLNDLGGVLVRVLRPEDHLRVMCTHWLNDGGADRTRLWDIFFAIGNRPPEFEPERFIGVAPENRKKWLLIVLAVVRDYLGLEIDAELYGGAEKYKNPVWVRKTLEKEWGSDRRLIPLQRVTHDGREFFRQMLKRIPPNRLQAMVETEGAAGENTDPKARLINVLKRVRPSVRRLLGIDPDV